MSGSYRIQHQPKLEPQETVCDYCNNATALIYCRADTAKLCFSCDFEVHATNDLFSKHARSQICDLCDAGPASIFCETERSVFCQNCDWEKHSVAELSTHSRRPVEGYTGCPSVSELMGILGFDDLGVKKSMFLSDGSIDSEVVGSSREDGFSDLLIWSTPSALSFSNLIASCDSRNDFKALDVPPLPKNRNATCGQRKEEILYQLRELARSKANASYKDSDSNELFQLLSAQTWQRQDSYAVCDPYKQEEDVLCWFNDTHGDQNQGFHNSTLASSNCEESFVVPDKQSNIGASTSNVANADSETDLQQSLAARSLQVIPKTGFHELNSQERDSAISRYKEKRKTRRYDKHIRYESRKLRAETRTRIKGRFAKV